MTDLEFIGSALTALGFVVGGVVWLVRLEGKTMANTVAQEADRQRLAAHMVAQDRTHDDLIRVQEQLKHLTTTMQQWMSQPPRDRAP